jgi:AraC family transcriptional regulator
MTSRSDIRGSIVAQRDADGFVVTDATYAARQTIAPHSHERAYLSLAITGRYLEQVSGGTTVAESGTLILHPAGERHQNVFDAAGGRCLNVELSPATLDDVWPGRHLSRIDRAPVRAIGTAARICRLIADGDVFGLEDTVAQLLVEVIGGDRSAAATPWLCRAREAVHDHPAAITSLSALARSLGVHPVYLSRAYRAAFGRTMRHDLMESRVRQALRLLPDPSVTLAEVALAAGFADQSHLTRALREHLGWTPASWRRFSRSAAIP